MSSGPLGLSNVGRRSQRTCWLVSGATRVASVACLLRTGCVRQLLRAMWMIKRRPVVVAGRRFRRRRGWTGSSLRWL